MFALIDCNNFYVSCERAFAPGLNRKPVVVLSNNDGCIISRSSEAKHLGIQMGTPAFKVQRLLREKNVAVFSSNYTLYGDMSRRVMEILGGFSPNIEVYSIDEAFLFFDGVPTGIVSEKGHDIRIRVMEWTGIPTSVGFGPTKTLAKIANRLSKREASGVFELCPGPDADHELDSLDVADVWGIGFRHAKLLREHGIRTAGQLRDADLGWIRAMLTVTGMRTVLELRGESWHQIETRPAARKEITVSRTFSSQIRSLEELKSAVTAFAGLAAKRLMASNLAAQTVTVFAGTNPYAESAQRHSYAKLGLELPSCSARDIAFFAREAAGELFDSEFAYKKAGVTLGGLVSTKQFQPTLFKPDADLKSDGCVRDRIQSGASVFSHAWDARAQHLSGRYTTCWKELQTAR